MSSILQPKAAAQVFNGSFTLREVLTGENLVISTRPVTRPSHAAETKMGCAVYSEVVITFRLCGRISTWRQQRQKSLPETTHDGKFQRLPLPKQAAMTQARPN